MRESSWTDWRHWMRWAIGIAVAVIIGLSAASSLTYARQRDRDYARLVSIAEQNRANGEAIRHAVDILLSVTGPEAQARSAASTKDILLRNAIETDCRSRRQQVRLPAPDPARSCAEQTDPSVYPGVDGQPAKGP